MFKVENSWHVSYLILLEVYRPWKYKCVFLWPLPAKRASSLAYWEQDPVCPWCFPSPRRNENLKESCCPKPNIQRVIPKKKKTGQQPCDLYGSTYDPWSLHPLQHRLWSGEGAAVDFRGILRHLRTHQPFDSQHMVEHANPQSLRCRPQQPPDLLAETSISPISSSFIGFTLSFYHLYRFYDVLNPSFISFQILS